MPECRYFQFWQDKTGSYKESSGSVWALFGRRAPHYAEDRVAFSRKACAPVCLNCILRGRSPKSLSPRALLLYPSAEVMQNFGRILVDEHWPWLFLWGKRRSHTEHSVPSCGNLDSAQRILSDRSPPCKAKQEPAKTANRTSELIRRTLRFMKRWKCRRRHGARSAGFKDAFRS